MRPPRCTAPTCSRSTPRRRRAVEATAARRPRAGLPLVRSAPTARRSRSRTTPRSRRCTPGGAARLGGVIEAGVAAVRELGDRPVRAASGRASARATTSSARTTRPRWSTASAPRSRATTDDGHAGVRPPGALHVALDDAGVDDVTDDAACAPSVAPTTSRTGATGAPAARRRRGARSARERSTDRRRARRGAGADRGRGARAAGRDPATVRLVGASKTVAGRAAASRRSTPGSPTSARTAPRSCWPRRRSLADHATRADLALRRAAPAQQGDRARAVGHVVALGRPARARRGDRAARARRRRVLVEVNVGEEPQRAAARPARRRALVDALRELGLDVAGPHDGGAAGRGPARLVRRAA